MLLHWKRMFLIGCLLQLEVNVPVRAALEALFEAITLQGACTAFHFKYAPTKSVTRYSVIGWTG
jgi:hypothetical protein